MECMSSTSALMRKEAEEILRRLNAELKSRGFSERTVQSYLFHNRKFLDFIGKAPGEIGTDDIRQYIVHLVSDRKHKPSSVNLAICSLKFLYEQVFEKDILRKIQSLKTERKLPTVLTKAEKINKMELWKK